MSWASTHPLVLVAVYLLMRKYFKARDFSVSVGLCFVLSLALLAASIGIGRASSIRYLMYQDVLLEKAIAHYEDPPQVLLDYRNADGAKNVFAFSGVYAVILLLAWSPILLVCWVFDLILTRIRRSRGHIIANPSTAPAA